MWVHGHSMQIEYPNNVDSVHRKGYSIQVNGKGGTSNWFHFAIPTPVIVNDNRLRVGSVFIRFKSGGQGYVKAVHVYDGETKIFAKDDFNLYPKDWHVEKINIPGNPEIKWGLGISIGVKFGVDDRSLEFSSAGCDFLP